jgi:hypothetical protein
MVPFLMALGMGMSVINGLAVLEGLFGRKGTEFVRTPKYGAAGGTRTTDWKKKAGSFNKKKLSLLPFVEIIFGLYLLFCASVAMWFDSAWGTVPFLIIFAVGYLYVGVLTIHSRWLAVRARALATIPEQAGAEALAA